MSSERMLLGASGSAEIPAILVLRSLGFTVLRVDAVATGEQWTAESMDATYSAGSPLELLGLVSIHRARGADWRASDAEIAACLADYYGVE